VVVTQNIVRCAAWLLFTLGGTAGIFFLLGSDFVGATQVIVYVGGILVLVVFGVMLTAQGPFITMKTGAAEWVISLFVGLLLFGVMTGSLLATRWTEAENAPPDLRNPSTSSNSVVLGTALLGIEEATPDANLTGPADPNKPRTRKKVSYLLPFEIVSVHLLVVLIGAAYLARAKKRRSELLQGRAMP
jgi:NADH:ubiquinone oxidoreductase subunit 6 (subunit J)